MTDNEQLPAWWLYTFYAVLLLGCLYGTLNPCRPFWQQPEMVAIREVR